MFYNVTGASYGCPCHECEEGDKEGVLEGSKIRYFKTFLLRII